MAVNHFSDYDLALDEIEANAVLVTTPPRLHSSVLINALARGKHALVEKPLAVSSEDAAYIARAVTKTDAKVMVGQGYRFMDSATILRQAFQSGTLGELQAIRILFRSIYPRHPGAESSVVSAAALDPDRHGQSPFRSDPLLDPPGIFEGDRLRVPNP